MDIARYADELFDVIKSIPPTSTKKYGTLITLNEIINSFLPYREYGIDFLETILFFLEKQERINLVRMTDFDDQLILGVRIK